LRALRRWAYHEYEVIAMLKRLSGVALLLALAACASTHTPRSANAVPPGCVASTGTRLPVSDKCAGPGRTYTQEDIDRTGATTAGEALRNLNPALTIGGH
jgi:hypothetical protein